MHLRLADDGMTFATRPRARSIVERLAGTAETEQLGLDLTDVQAASPGFLDEFFSRLSEQYEAVTITGATPDLLPLIDRVIARRGLESRFRVTAEA